MLPLTSQQQQVTLLKTLFCTDWGTWNPRRLLQGGPIGIYLTDVKLSSRNHVCVSSTRVLQNTANSKRCQTRGRHSPVTQAINNPSLRVQPTSSASPPPVGRSMNPVTEEPPSSPSAQETRIAVRKIADDVGGGHALGATAGVRAEYVGGEKAPCRKSEIRHWAATEERKRVRLGQRRHKAILLSCS